MQRNELVHGELSHEVVGAFYEVYRELGSGFLEGAYQRAMVIALADRGLTCRREVPTTVHFRGHVVGEYRMDLLVSDVIIVECKKAEKIGEPHRVQTLNYLRAADLRLGMILNFGNTPTFARVVNDTNRKRLR